MNVGELKEQLAQFPDHWPVRIRMLPHPRDRHPRTGDDLPEANLEAFTRQNFWPVGNYVTLEGVALWL